MANDEANVSNWKEEEKKKKILAKEEKRNSKLLKQEEKRKSKEDKKRSKEELKMKKKLEKEQSKRDKKQITNMQSEPKLGVKKTKSETQSVKSETKSNKAERDAFQFIKSRFVMPRRQKGYVFPVTPGPARYPVTNINYPIMKARRQKDLTKRMLNGTRPPAYTMGIKHSEMREFYNKIQ